MRGRVWLDRRTRGRPAWCIVWEDLNGGIHRQRTEAANKAQAQALLNKKQSDLIDARVTGKPLEDLKSVPFSEFLKEFMSRGAKVYTSATYKGYTSLARAVDGHFGTKPLRGITRKDVKDFYQSHDEEKPATANRYLSFLSAVFREALDRSLVDFNPARGIKKRHEDNFKLRFLSDVEEKRLEKFLPVWMRPVVTLAIHTGLRRSEVLQLTWGDVDFTTSRIAVRLAKNHRERHVPMNQTVKDLLSGMCPPAETWEESPYVFSIGDGEPIHPSTVSHAFREAVGRARIAGVSFHTCRHTTASRMVQRGVPLKAVQEILGHSCMNVTLRYAALAKGNLDDAVSVLDSPQMSTQTVQSETAIRAAR